MSRTLRATILTRYPALVVPLALARPRKGEPSPARDLGVVLVLTLVGVASFVRGDDVHALAVSVALGRLGWRGWRA